MKTVHFEKQFNAVYRGKTVLLTGHTGFKGSWLGFWLSRLGAQVIGYSKDFPSQPNHFELLPSPPDFHVYTADLRDYQTLQRVIADHQPDMVFHLAAQSLVRYSYAHPLETISSNVMGTANLLEACRQSGCVRAIINVTSDKCYENNDEGRPFLETDRMGGHDPYSFTKGASELLTNCYRRSFFEQGGVLLASGRAGNVIGGGDWALDRLIPDLVKATVAGKETLIRNPNATRPWQHVLEPLSGYLQLGQQLLEGRTSFADGWNFGPKDGEALTVLEVLEIFERYWPAMQYTFDRDRDHPHEAALLSLDCSKARRELNWEPVWDSAQAIAKTVNWYRHYYQHENLLTLEDLTDYSREAHRLGLSWATSLCQDEVLTD